MVCAGPSQGPRRAPVGILLTKDDLKRVILECWEDISLKEIQDRIDEMPERCAWLVNNGGKGIKSATW